jgi:hypothetical protein
MARHFKGIPLRKEYIKYFTPENIILKNAVFWDVTPFDSSLNRCDQQLLDTADVVPSLLILVTLMMEAICSCETSALTSATRRHIPEDGILHSHFRENTKSYIALTG